MKTKHFIMLLFLIACVFRLSAIDKEAQTVDIKTDHLSIKQLFTEIEKQTDYLILLRNDDVDVNRIVHLKSKTGEPAAILEEAFRDTDINYVFENKYIVLSKSNSSGQQQAQKKITGTVVDENGEAIIGANVAEKGANSRTITDMEGKFSINVSENSIIQISFIGYIPQEIAVGNRQIINVQLKEDTQKLDEVVVVGYGVQKKVNLTGAVSAVSGADLNKRPVTNPATMLQGLIPGLSVMQGTGQPGAESTTLRVRGQGTYSSAGSDPLVLIDGVPGSLSALNANDIENVSVLKDANSASIYGARAANGVILVTTKTGAENQFKLAYNLNVGIHSPSGKINLITNSADYMRLLNEAKQNSGVANASNTYTDAMISLYENATDRVKYPNFDWMDYALSPALVQNHDLSLSGGSKGTTYNISVAYVNQPGILIGYGFDKYNFRTNLKSKLKDWVTVGTNLFLERGDVKATAQGQSDAFVALLQQAPTYGPKLPDGSGRYTWNAYSFENHNKNQVAIVENGIINNSVNYNAAAQLWIEFNLFDKLKWYTKGAVDYTDNTTKNWRAKVPTYNYHTGEYISDLDVGTYGLTVTGQKTFYTNLHSYLKYDLDLEYNHLSVQLGYSQETNRYDNLRGYRQFFPSDLRELDAGTAEIQTNGGYAYEWALRSVFGRLNYDYKGRYLADISFRYDGTSRMVNDQRWGFFPSFSAGWRLTEEDFVKNAEIKWLNNVKIRGSYGLLGNQNINVNGQPYPYQALLSYTGAYPFDNSALATGVSQTVFSNRNIKWESTSIFDIGLDLTVFNGLTVNYDYYRKNTTDILRNAQTSALLGMSAPIVNSGAMINYGHEISVQYTGYVASGTFSDLHYGGGLYFNKYKNEAANFGVEEIDGYYMRKNGTPYNSYYMLKCTGVFQTQEEIDKSPKQFTDNVKPGDLKYWDADGNGVVDNADRVIVPGKFPDFEYSFNLFANWKGFDLYAFFQGVSGSKTFANSEGVRGFVGGSAAPLAEWLTDRWTGPGTSNWLPRITFNSEGNSQNRRNSTWFLQDNSYFRLKNLTVGYTLPKNLSTRIYCEKIRVYFSGDNLFTVTKFKGFDPERTGDGNLIQYPQSKIFSLGLNVEF